MSLLLIRLQDAVNEIAVAFYPVCRACYRALCCFHQRPRCYSLGAAQVLPVIMYTLQMLKRVATAKRIHTFLTISVQGKAI